MIKVSVLGSGMMGSSLTYALLRGGHDVMVFDLDAAKMEPLVQAGATAATSGVELAEHCDFFIPSLPTYGGLRKYLDSEDVKAALQGKTIVQLSSGSPDVVEEFLAFIAGTGINYLEGRIKAYPKDIGKPGSKIIFSGDENLFIQSQPVMTSLAEHLVYLGTEAKTVSVLDEAVVVTSYGQYWGLVLAGKLCQAHNISPLVLLDLVRGTSVLNLDDMHNNGYPELISGTYREDSGTAAINTWTDAADQTLVALQAAGLDATVFKTINDTLKKAEAKGHGGLPIYAIAEVMND